MKKAFTLTELLVAIVIVLVLASLLLPVFSQVRDVSKETVCVSNLRQIYTAIKLYQGDYGEYPPNNLTWPGLRPYYPVQLSCYAKPKDRNHIPGFDYLLLAQGWPDDPSFPNARKEWLECRDIRGPMMPIIFDQNHTFRPYSGNWILARENGSIHKFPFPKEYRPNGPCAGTSVYEFNF